MNAFNYFQIGCIHKLPKQVMQIIQDYCQYNKKYQIDTDWGVYISYGNNHKNAFLNHIRNYKVYSIIMNMCATIGILPKLAAKINIAYKNGKSTIAELVIDNYDDIYKYIFDDVNYYCKGRWQIHITELMIE